MFRKQLYTMLPPAVLMHSDTADGCDICNIWFDRVTERNVGYLCDGHLQVLYSEYQSVLQKLDTLGQIEPLTVQAVLTQLENVRGTLLQEISLIVQGE